MDELIEKYAAVPAQQRYALIAMLIGGLVGAHYYFMYADQQTELEQIRKQYQKKIGEQDEKRQIAANLTEYQDKLAGTQRQLEIARAKLPDTSDVAQLLAQLGNKARQVGMAIADFKPGAEQSRGFYNEIPFDLKVSGSYNEVAMFIDSLSRMDRIVNVTQLSMAAPKSSESKVVVESKFKLVTYRFTKKDAGAPK